jgi:hypothetical protein
MTSNCYINNCITESLIIDPSNTCFSNINIITSSLQTDTLSGTNLNSFNFMSQDTKINNLQITNCNLTNTTINSNLIVNNIIGDPLVGRSGISSLYTTGNIQQLSPVLFLGNIRSQLNNFTYNQDDIIEYDIIIDLYNNWNNITCKYLIIQNGIYSINITSMSNNTGNKLNLKLIQSRNDTIITSNYLQGSQLNSSSEGFYILNCNANDLIWIACVNDNVQLNNNYSYGIFQIELI